MPSRSAFSRALLPAFALGTALLAPPASRPVHAQFVCANCATWTQQLVSYDRAALQRVAPHIRALSDAEALPAHGDAVDARFA